MSVEAQGKNWMKTYWIYRKVNFCPAMKAGGKKLLCSRQLMRAGPGYDMKKTTLILSLLISTSLIQGCSNLGVFGKQDDGCPAPSKDQLNKNGYLMLQNGITLKCQVKNYVSKMSCQGITDKTGADGLVCQSGNKQAAFVFDENGILKSHSFF